MTRLVWYSDEKSESFEILSTVKTIDLDALSEHRSCICHHFRLLHRGAEFCFLRLFLIFRQSQSQLSHLHRGYGVLSVRCNDAYCDRKFSYTHRTLCIQLLLCTDFDCHPMLSHLHRRQSFAWCSLLTSIVIPNSALGVGDRAFVGCISLVSFTISGSLTSIGEHLFGWYIGLQAVYLPEGSECPPNVFPRKAAIKRLNRNIHFLFNRRCDLCE